MKEVTMRYSNYKKHYADCKTVYGSYNENLKTIIVLVPDGRMKNSGVRGEKFRTVWLMVGHDADHMFRQGFRAVCCENAIKQAKKYFEVVNCEV